MVDESVRKHLHESLRVMRTVLVHKVDGLSEYDIRRPLTATGTNLLGLIKHVTPWESRYFGEVFDRPPRQEVPSWRNREANRASLWVTPEETRDQVIGRYERACRHSDSTIGALPIDARGHVPWWTIPDVTLSIVLSHMLAETARHAGHADILREQLDGAVGDEVSGPSRSVADRTAFCRQIDNAARQAESRR